MPFGPFYLAARLLTCMSAIAFALFTWIVFRRRDTWGLWVIGGTLVCMSAGLAGSAWVGDWEGIDPLRNPWWWAEWVDLTEVISIAMIWLAFLPLPFYRRGVRGAAPAAKAIKA